MESDSEFEIVTQLAYTGKGPSAHLESTVYTETARKAYIRKLEILIDCAST